MKVILNKLSYLRADMEIVEFPDGDVIATSTLLGPDGEDSDTNLPSDTWTPPSW